MTSDSVEAQARRGRQCDRRIRWLAMVGLASVLTALAFAASGSARTQSGVTPDVVTSITWTTGAPIPHGHVEGAVAAFGTKILVISGGAADCTDGHPSDAVALVDVYNTSTGTWSSGTNVNVPRTNIPFAAVVGTKAYLIGGAGPVCGGGTVRTVEVYDSVAKTWTALPSSSDLPAALDGSYHCGVAVGTKIYDFQQNGIGVFDTTTLTWSVLSADPLLAPSLFCQAVRKGPNDPTSLKAKVIITGPGDGSADAFSQRVLVFKPATGTITKLSGTTAPMAEHTSVFVKARAVVIGGDFAPATVQLINLRSGTVTNAAELPQSSDDAVAALVGGKIYVLGGTDGASNTPPVLIGTPS